MAYLITCAGSKVIPLEINPSELSLLSFNETLSEARKEIIKITGVQLNWKYTLPAWKLYSGTRSKLYPQIEQKNWTKQCVEIEILSALFGWIKHTDNIPIYNLRMSDRRGIKNQQVWRIWYDMHILDQFVHPGDIDLLSYDYRRAIHGNVKPVSVIPNVIFNDYGIKKGKWLSNELNNINC